MKAFLLEVGETVFKAVLVWVAIVLAGLVVFGPGLLLAWWLS